MTLLLSFKAVGDLITKTREWVPRQVTPTQGVVGIRKDGWFTNSKIKSRIIRSCMGCVWSGIVLQKQYSHNSPFYGVSSSKFPVVHPTKTQICSSLYWWCNPMAGIFWGALRLCSRTLKLESFELAFGFEASWGAVNRRAATSLLQNLGIIMMKPNFIHDDHTNHKTSIFPCKSI